VTEIEFMLPDGLEIQRLAAALSVDGFEVVSVVGDEDRTHRVYYDTFDGRLRAAGSPAVHERGRLVLDSVEALMEPPPHRVLADELSPGPLREKLRRLIDVRALLPLAELYVSQERLRILDRERKTVVRASIERSRLAGFSEPLRSRLQLVALRGYDAELERVGYALRRELGLMRAQSALVDEAVVVLGGTPGGCSSKIDVALAPGQRADSGAVAVLRRLLEVIEQNLDGTIADLDSEFVHDLRVAVRRSRSVQRQLSGVFPPGELGPFQAEFRWVQAVTGRVRDLDVYLLGFESMRELVPEPLRAELEPLRALLREHRHAARERMVQDLRSERFQSLVSGFSALLDRLESLPEDDRPDAATAIGALAAHRISTVYRRIVKGGRMIDEDGPSEPFHQLRKRGKELRYLLELFGIPLFPEPVVRPMIKTLKGLQDVLGRHQDREVQVATLSALAAELPAARGPLLATGALIARLDEDKWAARREFAEHFKAFASRHQRELVTDTFS
jgi:CHAD domain-containing protein